MTACSSARPFVLGRGLWKSGDGAVIDGVGPDGIAAATRNLAGRASRLQSGFVYHYAFAMLIGLVASCDLVPVRVLPVGPRYGFIPHSLPDHVPAARRRGVHSSDPGRRVTVARERALGALWTSLATFVISLLLWFNFDKSTADFQFVEKFEWLPSLNIAYHMGHRRHFALLRDPVDLPDTDLCACLPGSHLNVV